VQMAPKCPVDGQDDFALYYTPGVAEVSRVIAAHGERSFDLTNRGNTVAIVSDGTRVLGLGDIGPEAALPVMEGKALLFKLLGGVDAIPICLASRSGDELVRAVEMLAPTMGGINLEDIAMPKCFRVLERLRSSLKIPVWHDDEQGSAAVVIAGLHNALMVVGKDPHRARIALIGAGAAGIATYRLLVASGIDAKAIRLCDRKGVLHADRDDLRRDAESYPEKWQVATESNGDGIRGGAREALRGADVCVAFSSPGAIEPAWITEMATDAIVFANANPIPEVYPADAIAAGARVVGTGRSDFPNQVNNSLIFPGLFRGALDVRASGITDGMAIAAARELAAYARDAGLREDRILPTMNDWQAAPRVAAAVGVAAATDGVARAPMDREQLLDVATEKVRTARDLLDALVATRVIAPRDR